MAGEATDAPSSTASPRAGIGSCSFRRTATPPRPDGPHPVHTSGTWRCPRSTRCSWSGGGPSKAATTLHAGPRGTPATCTARRSLSTITAAAWACPRCCGTRISTWRWTTRCAVYRTSTCVSRHCTPGPGRRACCSPCPTPPSTRPTPTRWRVGRGAGRWCTSETSTAVTTPSASSSRARPVTTGTWWRGSGRTSTAGRT